MKVTFVVISFLPIVLSTYDPEKLDEGDCTYFARAKHINVQWMTEQGKKGWYFPMLSGKNANTWKLILTGQPLKSESQLEEMCLMLFVHGNTITATGYGGHKAVFNCTVGTNNGGSGKEKKECHPTAESSYPEFAQRAVESSMSVSWTDNKENLVSVRCLKGQKIWALISSNPVVDEAVEERVKGHIRSLGFSPAKAVKLNYKHCPDYVQAVGGVGTGEPVDVMRNIKEAMSLKRFILRSEVLKLYKNYMKIGRLIEEFNKDSGSAKEMRMEWVHWVRGEFQLRKDVDPNDELIIKTLLSHGARQLDELERSLRLANS